MNFQFLYPRTLGEALTLLATSGPQTNIIAGGTDLLVKLKRKVLYANRVIDITGVDGLDYLGEQDGQMVIGAAVTHNAVISYPLIAAKYTALSDGSRQLGSLQVRNLATVVGNICNASPSAETAPGLLVLGAKVEIASCQGIRQLELAEFLVGPGRTSLASGEIVTRILIPQPQPSTGSAYIKLSPRRAMDTAVVGAAALVRIDPGSGQCLDCRIALGAVGPTPLQIHIGETLLGSKLSSEAVAKAGDLAAKQARPISDLRATAEYRREMVSVITRRALETAWRRAEGVPHETGN